MHMDVSPLKIETHGNPKHFRWGLGGDVQKEVRYEDHIEFSETGKNWSRYAQNKSEVYAHGTDKEQIEKAKQIQIKSAAAFGKVFTEGEQTVMPPGMASIPQARHLMTS